MRVQKLFTTFPTGAPGAALLLLRCALAIALILVVDAPLAIRLGAGILIGLGLLTPLISPIAGLLALACVWLDRNADPGLCALLAVHACALCLLGPGAYSLDSRLFGRRLVVWPPESK
ncbi:MAG TPA: hypothetical protein VGD45_24800 [Steroidobacter sp.]|uniref:hypothetical protein n=1 Tax=Steroidobacter sp. TaxID=1978227 RepID=UPI002ED9A977